MLHKNNKFFVIPKGQEELTVILEDDQYKREVKTQRQCVGFEAFEQFQYCLTNHNNLSLISIKNSADQQLILSKNLTFRADAMKFLKKENSVSYLILTDSQRNKFILVKLDTADGSMKSKVLNEQSFLVDSLYISDFSFFLWESDLFLFVFDEFQNAFYNYRVNLTGFVSHIMNNVSISLDALDFIHHKMNCANGPDDTYHCVFLGINKITIFSIKQNAESHNFEIRVLG